ncbi:hypothetical protein [Streptomyces cinereoruber]|uniref:hypothetical protein n=1 Tax=Streptomyces cinereoruber TaxID=67260 RepID=UPI00364409AD
MSRSLNARLLLLERRHAEAVSLGDEILTMLREQREDASEWGVRMYEATLQDVASILSTARESRR